MRFVSTSTSPARARLCDHTREASTLPVTLRPHFGSGSTIVCPPTIAHRARAHTSRTPARISPSASIGSLSEGNPTNVIASSGRPPIAYTSEIEFDAAIAPNARGSSTIGVITSIVSTSARWPSAPAVTDRTRGPAPPIGVASPSPSSRYTCAIAASSMGPASSFTHG